MDWLILVFIMILPIWIIVLMKRNEKLNEDLSVCKNEIEKYKRDIEKIQITIKNAEEKAIAPYIEEINGLKSQCDSLKKQNNSMNRELANLNDELVYSNQVIQNLKNAPRGISFAEDNMPILWKNTPDKPYGDYTVYYSPRSHIYHTDRFCGSFDSIKMHLFKAYYIGMPCKRCATKYIDSAVIPNWFTEYLEKKNK